MNLVILMGRLTRDPEIRSTTTGSFVANYSLAVDRRFKKDGQEDTDFFDCTVFGKGAEFAEKYLHKGTKIVVQGRIQNNNFKGKDGNMVRRNVIVVESQEFAESKSTAGNTPSTGTSAPPDFMQIPDAIDEELPFN